MEQEAKTGTYKWIADSIRHHPEHLHTSVEDSFQKIFSGKYAFTHVWTLTLLVKMWDNQQLFAYSTGQLLHPNPGIRWLQEDEDLPDGRIQIFAIFRSRCLRIT